MPTKAELEAMVDDLEATCDAVVDILSDRRFDPEHRIARALDRLDVDLLDDEEDWIEDDEELG